MKTLIHYLKWARLMIEGDVPAQNIENIRRSHKVGISLLAQEEIAEIIQSGGFEKPIQFYQMAFIHGWFCRKETPFN